MNKFWLAKHNIVGSATYSIRRYATTPIGKIDLKAGGDGSKSSNSSSNKSSSWNRLSLGKKRKPPPKFQSKLKPKTEIRLHNPVFILIVVQSTQNTAYLGVILAGVAAGGMAISYVIYDFVEDYYSGILFDDAFAKVSVDPKVIDMVGTPMKGHGGLGPRGHPTNPKRTIYKDDQGGDRQIIMYFVLEGPNGKGTVYVNQIKNADGEYEYSVLSADVQRHGMRTMKRVFIIDNRFKRSGRGPRKGWFGMKPLWRPASDKNAFPQSN